mmetsp:Transcript_21606/g.74186  ORF Transcript_21606/g.74186 Transcript_21606/m.74186 type:complete len:213 (+) Transcript_21606:2350-2988(+)
MGSRIGSSGSSQGLPLQQRHRSGILGGAWGRPRPAEQPNPCHARACHLHEGHRRGCAAGPRRIGRAAHAGDNAAVSVAGRPGWRRAVCGRGSGSRRHGFDGQADLRRRRRAAALPAGRHPLRRQIRPRGLRGHARSSAAPRPRRHLASRRQGAEGAERQRRKCAHAHPGLRLVVGAPGAGPRGRRSGHPRGGGPAQKISIGAGQRPRLRPLR